MGIHTQMEGSGGILQSKFFASETANGDESNTGKLQIYKTAGRISTTVNRTLLVYYLPSED